MIEDSLNDVTRMLGDVAAMPGFLTKQFVNHSPPTSRFRRRVQRLGSMLETGPRF